MNYKTPLISYTWFIKRTRRYLVSPPAVWRELWPRPRLRWCSLTGFCLKRIIAWSQTRIHLKRRVLEAKMRVLPQACPYAAAWTNSTYRGGGRWRATSACFCICSNGIDRYSCTGRDAYENERENTSVSLSLSNWGPFSEPRLTHLRWFERCQIFYSW